MVGIEPSGRPELLSPPSESNYTDPKITGL
jgi:hypothetical protein